MSLSEVVFNCLIVENPQKMDQYSEKGKVQKARRPNFTSGEVNILIEEVLQDPELGRGELGGKYKSTSDLRNRWEEIATKINSSECFNRSGDKVKNKLMDMKTKIKKKAAQLKQHRDATGGGEPSKGSLTPLEEKVLQIIGTLVVSGLEEGVDIFKETEMLETKENEKDKIKLEIGEINVNENAALRKQKKTTGQGKENTPKK